MVEIKCSSEGKRHFSVNPKTKGGNEARIDGAVQYEVLEGDAEVIPDEEGNGAYLVSGAEGVTSRIKVSADADLGEGVQTIETEISFVVTAPQANDLGISVGEEEAK